MATGLHSASRKGIAGVLPGSATDRPTRHQGLFPAYADDLLATESYATCCDYFLFDTPCNGYGGSGKSFDWEMLTHYHGETPFLLSGGLKPESLDALLNFSHPHWAGIDLNSGFEQVPGLKDAAVLSDFIDSFKQNKYNL